MVEKTYALVCNETGDVKRTVLVDEDAFKADAEKYDRDIKLLKDKKAGLLANSKQAKILADRIKYMPIPPRPYVCPEGVTMVELTDGVGADTTFKYKNGKFEKKTPPTKDKVKSNDNPVE